jgi:hypothetical protein
MAILSGRTSPCSDEIRKSHSSEKGCAEKGRLHPADDSIRLHDGKNEAGIRLRHGHILSRDDANGMAGQFFLRKSKKKPDFSRF